MPTYEYKCRKCSYKFEKFQNMTDPPVKKCPECKGPVMRIISMGAGVIFKGKGFYQTDYKPSAGSAKTSTKSEKDNKKSPEVTPCGKTGSCASCPE